MTETIEKYIILTDEGKYSSMIFDKFFPRFSNKRQEKFKLFEIIKLKIKKTNNRESFSFDRIFPIDIKNEIRTEYSVVRYGNRKSKLLLYRNESEIITTTYYDFDYDVENNIKFISKEKKGTWPQAVRHSRFNFCSIIKKDGARNIEFTYNNNLIFDDLESAKLYYELIE